MDVRTLALASVAAVLACAAVPFVSPASAGEGWYVGVGAGWDQLKDPRLQGFGLNGRLSTRDALIVPGALGYKFQGLPIRLEAEGAWARHDTGGLTQGGTTFPSSGHAEVRSLMVNALYDVEITRRLGLSIGGGAGMASDRISFTNPLGAGELRTGARTGFMWQAIGGLAYSVSRDVDLFVEYHYRDLRNGSDHPAIAPYPGGNLTENVVMAGLRWYPWAAPETVAYRQPAPLPPEPVRPAPPPPPPPPPPAPVRTFIVFFDFDKTALSPEAEGVISEAVKTARETTAVRILITGHTDTVGSAAYNQTLSVRRADSVKEDMIRDGMQADDISTVGKGFDDPLVATGPGVREPQNRRAVIDLGG